MSAEKVSDTKISRRRLLGLGLITSGLATSGISTHDAMRYYSRIQDQGCVMDNPQKPLPLFSKSTPRTFGCNSEKPPINPRSLPHQWMTILLIIGGLPIAAIGATQEFFYRLEKSEMKKK